MIEISIDDRDIQQALSRLQRKLADMTPAMQKVGEDVLLSVKQNFEQAGRPSRWKPSRRVKQHGGKTLSDTGGLRDSMTYRAQANGVVIGTNVKYAAIHHFGGVIKPKTKKGLKIPGMKHPLKSVTMPARPFLMLQEADKRSIVNILKRYLEAP